MQLINLPGSFYVSDSAAGDGNVHLNVLPCCDEGAEKVVTAVLARYAVSISSEPVDGPETGDRPPWHDEPGLCFRYVMTQSSTEDPDP